MGDIKEEVENVVEKVEEKADEIMGKIEDAVNFDDKKRQILSLFERTKAKLVERFGNIFSMLTSRKNVLALGCAIYLGVDQPIACIVIIGLAMVLNTVEKRAYINKDTKADSEKAVEKQNFFERIISKF
jgi:hypothetical protein